MSLSDIWQWELVDENKAQGKVRRNWNQQATIVNVSYSNSLHLHKKRVLVTFKCPSCLYDTLITFAVHPSTSVDNNTTDIGYGIQQRVMTALNIYT